MFPTVYHFIITATGNTMHRNESPGSYITPNKSRGTQRFITRERSNARCNSDARLSIRWNKNILSVHSTESELDELKIASTFSHFPSLLGRQFNNTQTPLLTADTVNSYSDQYDGLQWQHTREGSVLKVPVLWDPDAIFDHLVEGQIYVAVGQFFTIKSHS